MKRTGISGTIVLSQSALTCIPAASLTTRPMEMKPFFPEVKQDAGPEGNEHDRDAKFEPATQPIRNIDLEKNDKASGQGKR